jgi:hypothetical protein
MTERYDGPIAFDESGDTVYVELTIDDLDASDWIGVAGAGHEVPGVTAAGEYEVKLIGNGHERGAWSARVILHGRPGVERSCQSLSRSDSRTAVLCSKRLRMAVSRM